MTLRFLPLALGLATGLSACGSESAEPGIPADTTATASAPDGSAPEADADLGALVGDIRTGIADLAAVAAESPDSARQRAVRLYVTRQEVIEANWGPRATGESDPLAEAVAEAETRHHRLMEVTGETPPDTAAIADAVAALDAQLGTVLERGAEAGVE